MLQVLAAKKIGDVVSQAKKLKKRVESVLSPKASETSRTDKNSTSLLRIGPPLDSFPRSYEPRMFIHKTILDHSIKYNGSLGRRRCMK